MFKRFVGLIPFVVLLAACGSGGDDHTPTAGADNGPGTTTPPGPVIQSVTVQTSSPQMASNGSAAAEITALVRDSKNQFLEGAVVSFASSSGGLAVTQATTDASGVAKATLSPAGDPTNRTVTVTATASPGTSTSTTATTGPMTGTATGTVNVDVVGTQLTVSGPISLALNDVGSYTVLLKDSGGVGIAGKAIAVSSSRSNTLTPTALTTDSSGSATFTLTAANGGTDSIGATGLGLSATQSTLISVDQFGFSQPAANTEVPLNTARTVVVRWTQAGVPQVGQTINFASTRGVLSAATGTTDASGNATVSIQSGNSGLAVLTATAATGVSSERTIEFVATTPASVDVQASPFTIATAEKSVITAVVRDALGNLVKNRIVQFSLQDITGGQLSTASVTSDSQGRAQTTYTASSSTSSKDGVVVTAVVQGATPAVQDSVALTVARREVFISLGTGNELVEPNIAQYELTYAVQVTDASGNGVANTPVTLELLSLEYGKGDWNTGTPWLQDVATTCADEDSGLFDISTGSTIGARNGILDGFEDKNLDGDLDSGEDTNGNGVLDFGEDTNHSGRIEAGNIATVAPRNVTTDANGFALVKVTYPQEYARWVKVRLTAATAVQGSEYARSVEFLLPVLADDISDPNVTPPGPVSPFGVAALCTNKN